MGVEYRIKFTCESRNNLDQLLRSNPYFASYDNAHGLYNFRMYEIENIAQMPAAYASLEPDGIIFCDCGGDDTEIIWGTLIRRLISVFGKLEIDEE